MSGRGDVVPASRTTTMSPVHRPRKKKKAVSISEMSSHGTLKTDPKTNARNPAFPLAAFLWPARKSTSQWVILPLTLMVVGLFRWVVGFWGFSGMIVYLTRSVDS